MIRRQRKKWCLGLTYAQAILSIPIYADRTYMMWKAVPKLSLP